MQKKCFFPYLTSFNLKFFTDVAVVFKVYEFHKKHVFLLNILIWVLIRAIEWKSHVMFAPIDHLKKCFYSNGESWSLAIVLKVIDIQ